MNVGSMSTVSERASVCAICGGPIDPSSQICARCGSVANRIGMCAQCQTVTSLESHKHLFWVCAVCGVARMTQQSCEEISAVRNDLRKATRAHRFATLAQVVSYLGAGIGLVGLLFVLTIQSVFSASGSASEFMYSLPLLTLVLSALGFLKTQNLRKTRDANLDDAYGLAILEVVSKNNIGATPGQLAESLGIQPLTAERLLAHLNVRDEIASEVTDEGQIAYFQPKC